MNLHEILGWIGSIAFALSAIPQMFKSYKDKNSDGLAWGLLILWIVGELFSLLYVLPLNQYPMITNYIVNLIFLFVILYYKINPTRKNKTVL